MQNRPLCCMAIALILGICFASCGNTWVCVVAIVAVVMVAISFYRKGHKLQFFLQSAMLFGCFILGNQRFSTDMQLREKVSCYAEDGIETRVQGTVIKKEYKNYQYCYYLENCYAVFQNEILKCNQIMFYSEDNLYKIGQTLVLTGTVKEHETARNEGNFDEKSYYESLKIDFKLEDVLVEQVQGEAFILGEMLFDLRQQLKQIYQSYMSEADSGVMSTMVLGDKSLLDAEVKALYQSAGISHILAISGLHISVIGMGLYKLLRRLYLSIYASAFVSAAIMICYGIMCGAGTSTKRAVLMFLIMLVGQCMGRSYDSLSALALAAILLLCENPFLLQYAGFLFSFSAVLGVVVVGKTVGKFFHELKGIKNTLVVSFCIQLVTLPLTAFFYYEIPVYSILINLVVLPLLGILLFCGLLGGICGLLAGVLTLGGFSFFAKIFLFPCHLILLWNQALCGLADKLPGAMLITGAIDAWKLLAFYVCLGLLLLVTGYIKRGKKSTFFVGSGALLFFALLNCNRGLEFCVLDVGQGAGCYLRTEEGYNIFFDGGSTDVNKVGTYRILPFLKAKGAAMIDCWVISHTDTDHISGFIEVLESGYQVNTVVFSKETVVDETYEELLLLCKDYGCEILYLRQGDRLCFGEGVLSCLFPDAAYNSDDKNAMSFVVSYAENDFSAVITGDIDTNAEERLVGAGILQRELSSGVLVCTASHHGSNYSNSAIFFEALQPKIITISAGEDNTYGHPGADAVTRMKESGAHIFSTIEGGQITVTGEGEVYLYCESPVNTE